MAQQKLQDGDTLFLLGQNSQLDPMLLPPGSYARGENVVNRGGIVQCRPGYRCKFEFPEGNAQGGFIFRPLNGPNTFVFAVSGSVYASEYPYKTFRKLPNLQFSPTASQLYFEQVQQSVKKNEDGSLQLIDPVSQLVIQDGGFAKAAIFDGAIAEHTTEIPPGGPMAWLADRLWLAQGHRLLASDHGNPTSFTEFIYIANAVKAFVLPGQITALGKVPTVTSPQLLVFTETTGSLFQVGVRNRGLWSSFTDFQKLVFPNIGCLSQRSVVAHNGLLWWYAAHGLTNIDVAAQSEVSSTMVYVDSEMTDSKSRLSGDKSRVASASFENYLLVSVPHEDLYNAHTWVLDGSPLVGGGKPAWNGVWTGTRPIEWFVDGDKCFFISTDYDGESRFWEAFTPDRLDNGCPITWWAEFRSLNMGAPAKFKNFRYADVFMSELSGTVDVAVFWAGGHRGQYKRILTKRVQAAEGSLQPGVELTIDSQIFALKKQSRHLRTQDGKALDNDGELTSCGVESEKMEFKDESFQLLVVGSGPGAVRGLVTFAEFPENDDDSGRVEEDEEEDDNFVRFDGAASDELSDLSEDLPIFNATKTVTVSRAGFTQIASASAESLISQANADYVAETAARRIANTLLEQVLPEIVSIGALANEI